MSKLESQKSAALDHVKACQECLARVLDREKGSAAVHNADLWLGWMDERFAAIKAEIGGINVAAVESQWRTSQPTTGVLDPYTNAAESEFRKQNSGVIACLDTIGQKYLEQFQKGSIADLERIRVRSQATLRLLYFMPRRRLAFLLSWRFAALLILLGLLAGVGAYIAVHHRPGTSPVETTKSAISHDVTQVKKTADEPHESSLDKGIKTTTAAIKQIPDLSKDLVALFTAIAAVLKLIVGPSVKKAKGE